MKVIASVLLFLIIFALSTKEAKAIIVIIPVILIPIVKMVVLIIGALTAPVVGLSVFYSKLKKKPVVFGILVGVFILLFLGLVITIGFKLINPARPLY